MRRISVTLILSAALTFIAGCPPPDDNEGMGEGAGEGSGEGSGEEQLAELVIELIETEFPGSFGHAVWVFAGSETYTRDTAPYAGNSTREFRIMSGDTEDNVKTFEIPLGDRVSIIAMDGNFSQFNQGNSVIEHEHSNEFVEFQGDLQNADMSRFGEMTFTMAEARSITGVFRRMPTVAIQSVQESGPPELGPGCYLIHIQDERFLSQPSSQFMIMNREGPLFCGAESTFAVGQLRSGSVISLSPYNQPQATFLFWTGDCMGSGDCTLIAGEGFTATAHWQVMDPAP